MKVLQINSVYGVGSTGKITKDIHRQLLLNGIDSVVLYGRGSAVDEPCVYRVSNDYYARANNLLSRFTGIRYGGCRYSTDKIFRIILREKPDVVHLQCINEYFVNIYRLIDWLKNRHIPTVITLHAEFIYTANCPHAFECSKWQTGCGRCPRLYKATKSIFFDRTHESYLRMQTAFNGLKNQLEIVSVSPWLMERAKQSPILADKQHRVIFNGVDTEIFFPHCDDDIDDIKNSYCKNSEKIVFHATAFFRDTDDDPKGGACVVELARRLQQDNVVFLIAGKNSVHGQFPENLVLLGEIKDQNRLAEYYSAADVTLLTSKRETYSMVCAESLCCGTPVVGFEAGAPEQISLPEYSTFVPQGDTDALEAELRKRLAMEKDLSLPIAAKAKYGEEKMFAAYLDTYRTIMDKGAEY